MTTYRIYGGEDIGDGLGEYVSTNSDGTLNLKVVFVISETGKDIPGFEGKIVVVSAEPPFPGKSLASGFRRILREPWLDDA